MGKSAGAFIARSILKLIVDRDRRDAVIGDIEEIYENICSRDGRLSGAFWYWKEVFRTAPRIMIQRLGNWFALNIRYFILASRNLKKNRVYTILNVAGLSIGIGVFALMFLMIQKEMSYDKFHKNSEEIYQLGSRVKTPKGYVKQWVTAPRGATFLKERFPAVTESARMLDQHTTIRIGEKTFREYVSFVDSGFFRIFAFGDVTESSFNNPVNAVITEEYASKFFGTAAAVGKEIVIKNYKGMMQNYRVSAVIKNIPENSSIIGDIFLPFSSLKNVLGAGFFNRWTGFCLKSFIRVKGGAESILDEFNRAAEKEAGIEYSHIAVNIEDIHFSNNIHAGDVEPVNPVYLWVAFSIGAIILFMGIVNLMNISYARIGNQLISTDIRKVMGAGRGDIFGIVIREYMLLTTVASLLGVIVTVVLKEQFSIKLTLDVTTYILYFTGCAIFPGLAAGALPAWMLACRKPSGRITGFTVKGSKFLNRMGVGLQFGMITILVFSGIVMKNQLDYAKEHKTGFDETTLVAMNLNGEDTRKIVERFRSRIAGYNSIISVSGVETFPGLGFNETRIFIGGSKMHAKIGLVDPWILETAGFAITEGGGRLKKGDFILNSKASAVSGLKTVIGSEVSFNKKAAGRVVSVVSNFHIDSLYEHIPPVVLRVSDSFRPEHMIIKISPGAQDVRKDISSVLKEVAPHYKPDLRGTRELFNAAYRSDEKWTRAINTSVVIAMIIAMFGLTGLAIVAMEKRKREIGIRKVLGAQKGELIVDMTAELIKWALIALVPALITGWLLTSRWLENFAYRAEPGISPYLIAVCIPILSAVVTAGVQVWRATMTDPSTILKGN